MNFLTKFTRKRVEQNTTRELISNGEFPIIKDEIISLVQYIGKQFEGEAWFINLSESGKLGVLIATDRMASRLIDIQKRNDGMKEEV